MEVIPAAAWEVIKRFLREKRTGKITLNVYKGTVGHCQLTERRKDLEERRALQSSTEKNNGTVPDR